MYFCDRLEHLTDRVTSKFLFLQATPIHNLIKKSIRLFLFLVFLISKNDTHAQENSFITNFPPVVYQASPAVYNIVIDHSGIMYFGTNKGVTIFDGARWETISISNFSEVRTLEIGPDSIIYVGANNNFGYLKIDAEFGYKYISISDAYLDKSINYNDIWQIVFLNDNIYFQSYAGIFTYDKKQVSFLELKEVFIHAIEDELYASNYYTGEFGIIEDGIIDPVPDFPKIKDDFIFQVFDYHDTHKLLVTSESGLYLFNPKTGKTSLFKTPLRNEFKQYSFYDGLKLDNNHYAMGTFNGGIFFMKRNGEVINVFNKENGLFANHIYDMKLDDRNNLWIATSYGISKIIVDSLGVSLPQKGLPTHKPVLHSIQMSFNNEITRLFPGRTTTNEHTQYKLAGNQLNVMSEPSSMSFYFAHPGFAGESISYSTFLEGNDQGWSEWRDEAVKEYTNLDGKTYTFHFKAKNEQTGEVSDAESFTLNISTPWHQTAWPTVLIIFVAIIIIYVLVRLTIRRLKIQNTRLEKLVTERTHNLIEQQEKLSELNKDLSTTNKELDSFVYHTSHDLKAPLKSILGLVSIAKLDDKDNKFVEYHERMENSIHKLEEFISSIIQYSTNSKSGMKPSELDFNVIVNEAISELQFHHDFDNIKFYKDINLNEQFVSDEQRFKIILNNLLSNAIKYCDLAKEEQRISVRITENRNNLHLIFEDNGVGINPEYQQKVFNMFYRASEQSYGSGLGLYIVNETVKKLNGTIKMESVEGAYTRFIITLPSQNNMVPA